MCVRQQSLMLKAFLPKEEGDGDAVTCSTDTSRWSTPSRLDRASDGPQSSERGDKADSLIDSALDDQPSLKWRGSKRSGFKKVKKIRESYKPTANRQSLNLPPVKPLQVSTPASSASCLKEFRSQVWDLKQQLSEAKTENKLLRKVQHRYEVALQHFQDAEGSIFQILDKHHNETRVLQQLLREARICRDNAAKQLQATESKLLETKAALQHLKLLTQDQSLLEREELTLRLAEATAKLEDKDRKIQDMEKALVLCQASFKRQTGIEQRKLKETRKMSFSLQQQMYQLTREIQGREKELEKHNIYSQRYMKGSSKQVRKNKMVQTDGLALISTSASHLVKRDHTVSGETPEQQQSSEHCDNPVQENLVAETPNSTLENHQEDTQMLAGHLPSFKDSSSKNSCSDEISEESLQNHNKDEPAKERDASGETNEAEREAGVSCILEISLNANEPKRKEYKLPTLKHNYIFKHSINNLHNGRPAYYNACDDSTECDEGEDSQQWDS